ncbi:hypothetical protein GE09DRAFT_1060951 [Coniochaeta sp. 2T2.1]|nr:hypothetical protein GE09DRAFT_1060951 [Coniochaeta sp. 2T2.1]
MVREGTGKETVYFDRDGDLRLEVGPEEATYVVCSRTLSRASPVFKAMLYGSFAEAKPADPKKTWIVKLPEDDPPALATLLNIMYGAFGKVPNNPTELELYGITLLTEVRPTTHYSTFG